MQCQHMRETSKSNSLRALYGEGGLSRLVQCKRSATHRFTNPVGGTRDLCHEHARSDFLNRSCIDPWIVEEIK